MKARAELGRIARRCSLGLFFFALEICLFNVLGIDFTSAASEEKELQIVKVTRLMVDPRTNTPIVLLADPNEERALAIWIGVVEANAIDSELKGIEHVRPLTHDLLARVIQRAEENVKKIVVTECKDNVFYATILIEKKGGILLKIDARPSDSIVLALKFKAPIYVSKELFEKMGFQTGKKVEVEQHYGLILQNLTRSLAQAFFYRKDKGLLVSDVIKGSQAEKDGMERGDIIVQVGEETLENIQSFRSILKTAPQSLSVLVFKKQRYQSLKLHPKR